MIREGYGFAVTEVRVARDMDNQDMDKVEHQDPQEDEFIDHQDAVEILPESAPADEEADDNSTFI